MKAILKRLDIFKEPIISVICYNCLIGMGLSVFLSFKYPKPLDPNLDYYYMGHGRYYTVPKQK